MLGLSDGCCVDREHGCRVDREPEEQSFHLKKLLSFASSVSLPPFDADLPSISTPATPRMTRA